MLGPTEAGRPLRAVVFTGGPTLDLAVRELIRRLEQEPGIEFAAAICESARQDLGGVVLDLWRRRGLLAVPLMIQRASVATGRFLSAPVALISLRRTIAALGDRIHFVPDIHADEVHERIRRLRPDLGLIYGSPILKPSLFTIPTFGTLGIHHGKVPEYRGKKTMFWAMYNGEPSAGVTIQHVGTGLDRGGVVAAGAVRTGRRPPWRVWRDLEALGFDLYLNAILDVKNGRADPRPQRGKRRKLYRDPGPADILVFWSRYLKRLVGRS